MKYICGLDIGSSKICGCFGCFKGRELVNLWWDSFPVTGVKRGQLQDLAGLTNSLAQLFKSLKIKSGVKIRSVDLSITIHNINVRNCRAIIALAERGNKSVSKADIQNVNRQAQILGSSLEDEILYTEPLNYKVDEDSLVSNPLGLYGHQLQVDLYLISAKVAYINTVIEVFNRLGVQVDDITLSGLAVSQAVFNSDKQKGLNILCDVGKDITQIIIFNDKSMVHYQIISCGGDDLTAELSHKLDVPYYLAEEIKLSHGRIQNNCDTEDKEIIIKKDDNYSTLSQNLVIEALSRSSKGIANAIRDVVRPHILAVSSPIIPTEATLYVCGRSAYLEGFLEILEVVIGMPVKMAKVTNPNLLAPLLRRRLFSGESALNYLACLGLISKAMKFPLKKEYRKPGLRNLLSHIPEKIKQIYQEYF